MGLEEKLTFHNVNTTDDTAQELLTSEAKLFLAELMQEFAGERDGLLRKRRERQQEYDDAKTPDFLESTKRIRDDHSWKAAGHPQDLLKRWVEITGPASNRKMVINALNSGADCYMADFEDSDVPAWQNLMNGQKNLVDAVAKKIYFKDGNKEYRLQDKTATLLVRPRGWHLPEGHVCFNDRTIPGALFDFGLYSFHNARTLLEKGSGPYFYLPKMESHHEARVWNDVFTWTQDRLKIPQGSIRATVLIETLPAAFEMDEILYELKNHISGLNCGRWDYIFSYIKKLNQHKDKILPDRDQVSMTQPFLQSYVNLLIQTCHKRGAYAMGGMAAQIPLKDSAANEIAMGKVRADKEREVTAGHDGTWVAHPGLVPLAREIFEKGMGGADNQLYKLREEVAVTAEDLLKVPQGTRTSEGLRKNIDVGIRYLTAWLSGNGCVPLYGLMEDAATAEISRAQVWQWLHHEVTLEDGRKVNESLCREMADSVYHAMRKEKSPIDKCTVGKILFGKIVENKKFEDFLTASAYESIVHGGK